MQKLLVTIAAAALVGLPLAALAQERDGPRGDGRDGSARSATAHGRDTAARTYDRHDRRAGGVGNRGYDRGRYGVAGNRGFYRRDGDDSRVRGGVGIGVGYGYGYGGAYPYGGGYAYGDEYPASGGYAYGGDDQAGGGDAYGDDDYPAAGGYGADYAYSYPDTQGTYQPFSYGYSDRDNAYYADRQPADGGDAYDRGQAAPNVGWSAGGPPADCGQWVWRDERGAYQWVAARC